MNAHDAHDLDGALRTTFTTRAGVEPPPHLLRRVLAIPTDRPVRRGRPSWLTFGGAKPMFDLTKLVAAGAVLALGGAFLTNVMTGPSNPEGPAGAQVVGSGQQTARVEGTVADAEWPEVEPVALGDGFYEWTSPPSVSQWQASDERLSGEGSFVEHGLQHYGSYTGLRTSTWTIENEDGTWTGSGQAFSSAAGGRDFLVLTGSGGYEGLSAYVAIGPGTTSVAKTDTRVFEGVIFPAAAPSPPEPAAE